MLGNRDTVAIAFSKSQYPTPYGDHTIAGNKPGHKERHLGRQYAPQPLTASQLTHALTAPFVSDLTPSEQTAGPLEVGHDAQHVGGSTCTPGPRRHTLLAAARYILNVRHGGKRHFDEPVSATAGWTPSVRLIEPPLGDQIVISRKGKGMYNFDQLDTVHEAAQRALERRERAARRVAVGKAHVDCPPDHHPIELGFYHLLAGCTTHGTSDADANGAQSDEVLTRLSSRAAYVAGQPQGNGDDAVVTASDADIADDHGNAHAVDANATAATIVRDVVPTITMGKIGRYCDASLRASDEKAMWYMEQKRFMDHWRATRRAMTMAAQKAEEIELVRHLPT